MTKTNSTDVETHSDNHHDASWFERPANIRGIIIGLIAFCAILLLSELFIEKHPYFDVESWFGFYGFFGFAAFVVIVFIGRGLRLIISRPEDYYDQ